MSKRDWTLFQIYDHVRQQSGQAPICQAATYERAEEGTGEKLKGITEFVMSTPGIKRDGFEIVQSGWQLDRFLANNPIALWRHSTAGKNDVLGTWPEAWKSSKGGMPLHLRGRLKWSPEDENPEAIFIQRRYNRGTMRACSVRWEESDAKAIEEITPKELEGENVDFWAQMLGGVRFLRADLIECSPCPLGLDKDAISEAVRSGEMPAGMVERFIANVVPLIGQTTDHGVSTVRTPEGREVLLLDGHPSRVTLDRPTHFDMNPARLIEADIVKIVPVPDLALDEPVARARKAQRLMRGEGDDGLEAALTGAYERAKEKPPWDGAMGQSYRSLHAALKDAAEAAAPALRQTIEQVGSHVFGAARLREEWEPRTLPPGLVDFWKPLGECAARVFNEELDDPVDADACVDVFLTEASRELAPVMDQILWCLGLRAHLETASGVHIAVGDDVGAAVAALRAGTPKQPDPKPPPPLPTGPDLNKLADEMADIRRRRVKPEPKPEPATLPAPTTRGGKYKSLLERLGTVSGSGDSSKDA